MGLPGFGMPWEESEEPWLLRRPGPPDLEDLTKTSDGGLPENGEDLPAEMLADEDSKFVQLDGIKVHYKEVHPPVGMVHADGSSGDGIAVVLVHGFGGGVFAWRHVMEPLAMQCQCRVVAFDRPAFGEWQRLEGMYSLILSSLYLRLQLHTVSVSLGVVIMDSCSNAIPAISSIVVSLLFN